MTTIERLDSQTEQGDGDKEIEVPAVDTDAHPLPVSLEVLKS